MIQTILKPTTQHFIFLSHHLQTPYTEQNMTLAFTTTIPLHSFTVTTTTTTANKCTCPIAQPTSSRRPRTRATNTPIQMAIMGVEEKAAYVQQVREKLNGHVAESTDTMWATMQAEARQAAEEEPLLASFLFSTILNHVSLPAALSFHLANLLASFSMPSTLLMRLFHDTLSRDPSIRAALREDLLAVMERDPACTRLIDALLYFKGFHALQTHRIAHSLWQAGRSPLAYHLQSSVSKQFQVDIHPNASIGTGAFLDHATGVVIGETAQIGRNCSMLHHVTLGGSGKTHGARHPKLGDGVLIGAGATILGNVRVGDGVQIGACSLVLSDVPKFATVVGVPARVVNRGNASVPSLEMKHERCIDCENGVDHKEHKFEKLSSKSA